VIGAAILATGLLLVVAGLSAARIPGGATFARPGIGRSRDDVGDAGRGLFAFARRAPNPVRAFILSPVHPETWRANGAIALGLLTGIGAAAPILTALSTGLTVLLAGIGFLFVALAIEGSRVAARIERWRAFAVEPGRPAPHPYRPLRGGFVDILRAEFADENRWRDVLYVAINLPLSIIEFLVAATFWTAGLSLATSPIWYDAVAGAGLPGFLGPLLGHDPVAITVRAVAGAALVMAAASISQLLIALHRGVAAALLCTSESRELRRQVAALQKSRSAVLDVEASELHRIERDLHDGAQQRLVMLTIDLGLASERLEDDPAAAKQLIVEGQEQARQALAELRDLVRGIAPSILLDRGLIAALESVTARGPVPTRLVSELPRGERLPAVAERTAYFVATEALANVAKHSGAKRCEVRCRREGSRLVVEVWDDGTGGAKVAPGGGLEGLEGRVAGVDGTLSISSPSGGPTLVHAAIPLAEVPAAQRADSG